MLVFVVGITITHGDVLSYGYDEVLDIFYSFHNPMLRSVALNQENFLKLLEYCKLQNDKGNTPHFLITNNPDFEYVACLHDIEYKGQDALNKRNSNIEEFFDVIDW